LIASSACAAIVVIAAVTGSTNSSSRISTITVTARLRLPQSLAWNQSSAGHVATTSIAAQIVAPRNGRSVHSDAMISATRVSTPSVYLARSGRASFTADLLVVRSTECAARRRRPAPCGRGARARALFRGQRRTTPPRSPIRRA
jgi:hypothetical protein